MVLFCEIAIMKRIAIIISQLSPQELRRFVDFARSPYFNKDQKVVLLAACIADFCDTEESLDDLDLLRDILANKVFVDHDATPQRFADLCTYLTRLAEQFIFQESIKQQTVETDLIALQAFRQRGLPAIYNKYCRKLNKAIAPHDFESQARFSTIRLRNTEPKALEAASQASQYASITAAFRWACSKLNRRDLRGNEVDLGFAETMDEYAARISELPERVALWRDLYHMLREPEQTGYYQAAFDRIKKLHQSLDHDEINDAYSYILNEGIRRYNQGDLEFRPQLFSLYRWLLENDVLLENGILSLNNYKNILTLATQLEAFDWAESFLKSYQPFLPKQAQKPAYAYNLAVLKKAQGDFSESLRLLQRVHVDEPFYQLGTRTLLAMIYYETSEHEALFSCLEAFEAYLRRTRSLGKAQRERHRNFVRFLRRLAKLRLRTFVRTVDAASFQKLHDKYAREPALTQRSWLLGQWEVFR